MNPVGTKLDPVAFVLVTFLGLLSIHYLFGFYEKRIKGVAKVGRSTVVKWDFDVKDLGGFSYWLLIVFSVAGMFFEMMMIRWVSSEIRIFAFFKNFVLVACFFGFGLGCYFSKRRVNLIALFMPFLWLCLLIELPWRPLRTLIRELPSLLGGSADVHIWGVPSMPENWPMTISAILITVPIFALLVFCFVPFGQLVGWLLENATAGIRAYSVNVVAGLGGIVLFTALCFADTPPVVWFLVFAALLLAGVWKIPRLRWTALVLSLACLALLLISKGDPSTTIYWSPYQKLSVRPIYVAGDIISYEVSTNDTWYQRIVDFSPDFLKRHPKLLSGQPVEWDPYNLPYRFSPLPRSVLVLGAGTGNDVAAALRNGAQRVTAVEIDPLILQLGRRLHFEKPYDSPKVTVVVDDARSYIQNSQDRFDLIVFSLLDSHTTSSNFSNIRIDNYVYTVEAMKSAKKLLLNDGLFVVKFQVDTPWIGGRLQGLLTTVFNQTPLQIQSANQYGTSGRFFIVGSQRKLATALSDSAASEYVRNNKGFEVSKASLTTDDWPYFYQHEPGIPLSVILISVLIVLMAVWFLARTGEGSLPIHWHFFFLGAGFLLLEVQIVSKIALLFGTTWMVNSIVIAALLLLIVAANATVSRIPLISRWIAYAGILIAAAVGYFVPMQSLFFPNPWVKGLAALGVLCLPVYFAGIIFARSFAEVAFNSEALGSNLLGAVVGGVLESISFWTGLRALLLVSVLLYLFSAIALRRREPASAVFGRPHHRGAKTQATFKAGI
jgi:SAM-dependent methyltransferase